MIYDDKQDIGPTWPKVTKRPNVSYFALTFFFQQNLRLIKNLRSLLESTYQEYTGRRSFDVFSCSKGYDPL